MVEKGNIDVNQLYEIAKLLGNSKTARSKSKDEATEETEKIKERKSNLSKEQ